MFEANTIFGGMLTGIQIAQSVERGDIVITPYDENKINPNSYNLTLDKQLKVYRYDECLDSHKRNQTEEIRIPKSGFILQPGILYIGRTVERTFSDKYIPMINGRSSGGRLGLSVHICAGFGDIGFDGTWTLEITVVHPLKVYAGDEVAQICYFTPYGNTSYQYTGRYNKQIEATPSKFYGEKTYSVKDALEYAREKSIYKGILNFYGPVQLFNIGVYNFDDCTINKELNENETVDSDGFIYSSDTDENGNTFHEMIGRVFNIGGENHYVRRKDHKETLQSGN